MKLVGYIIFSILPCSKKKIIFLCLSHNKNRLFFDNINLSLVLIKILVKKISEAL